MLDSVGLSFVELDGDVHAVNRFYLEDLAVGLMRPLLNIDVER
jgi:cell pole-organizing protein PopZ